MKPKYILILLSILFSFSCSEDYLDKKSNKALVVPHTLADFQAILDNCQDVVNIVPGLPLVASDDAFTTSSALQSLSTANERNSYFWAEDIYEGANCDDWNKPYQQIFYANVVLDGLSRIAITPANQAEWQNIKGFALFVRAHAMLNLAELFTAPYDAASAATTLGIPLRLTADVNAPVVRSTHEQTYRQIIADLTEAVECLPVNTISKTRPVAGSAYALLARTSLFMGDYKSAENYCSQALARNDYLIDFNTLNPESLSPVPNLNDETIYYATQITYGYLTRATTYIDTTLYASYHDDDLRKHIFFRLREPNRYSFKGSYTGGLIPFGGIANDEVYITRAEARVRLGDIDGALEDLNALLIKRWQSGKFQPITESDADALLQIILEERRKELVFRNLRWSDLRRLNQDTRFQKTLSRTIDGTTYTLPPNSVRYAFPIPQQEVAISGIVQNPR